MRLRKVSWNRLQGSVVEIKMRKECNQNEKTVLSSKLFCLNKHKTDLLFYGWYATGLEDSCETPTPIFEHHSLETKMLTLKTKKTTWSSCPEPTGPTLKSLALRPVVQCKILTLPENLSMEWDWQFTTTRDKNKVLRSCRLKCNVIDIIIVYLFVN